MKKIIFTIALIATGLMASAQVGVGNTDPKTSLHVTGTNNGAALTAVDGVTVPRVSTDMRDGQSAVDGVELGQLVYSTNAASTGFWFWAGATDKWNPLVAAASAPVFNISALQSGNYTAETTDTVIRFNNTSDVTVTLPTAGIPIGKTYYITAEGTANVLYSPVPVTLGYNATFAGTGSTAIYIGGTNYIITSGY